MLNLMYMPNIIERDLFKELIKHLQKEEITVLIGPRQVGKTTLLYQLRKHLEQQGVPQTRIKFFNLDVVTDHQTLQDQAAFIEYLKAEAGKDKLYVFVDEVQRLTNPGLFFKGIYDLGLLIKFVLTGSSALELKARVHEALTGRKRVFTLQPFSFSEYLRATEPELIPVLEGKIQSSIHHGNLLKAYTNYLVWGGYPKVVLSESASEKRVALEEIYQSYIEKDVVGFLRLTNPSSFTKCLAAISHQVGSLANVQELSGLLGVARATVERYLTILEHTFVLLRSQPYFTNPRTELKKMHKWFFKDTGLRNFIVGNLALWDARHDQGALLENAAAQTLAVAIPSPLALHFWRSKTKAEVDFVITTSPPIPLEVKLHTGERGLCSRSFTSFVERYKVKKGYIVSLSEEREVRTGDVVISIINPWHISEIVRTV